VVLITENDVIVDQGQKMTDLTIITALEQRVTKLEAALFSHTGMKNEIMSLKAKVGKLRAADHKKQVHPANVDTWQQYCRVFRHRYSTKPIQNAKNNASIKQLITRVGHDNAIALVKFYLKQEDAFYKVNCHNLGLLVKDCETLMVKMETGNSITMKQARKDEDTKANMRQSAEYLKKKHGLDR